MNGTEHNGIGIIIFCFTFENLNSQKQFKSYVVYNSVIFICICFCPQSKKCRETSEQSQKKYMYISNYFMEELCTVTILLRHVGVGVFGEIWLCVFVLAAADDKVK